jgi:hypothetical protein
MAQRILASHKDVATTSEPWILLPYLYTSQNRGVFAEYGHKIMVRAVEDFCHELENGVEDYMLEIRNLILRLYARAAKGETKYFLDKTPRYHLVVEDVMRLFPKGRFIFLWRNPLAVVSSIIETWGKGIWNLYGYKVDLFKGLANLVAAYQKNKPRVCSMRYEDLINDPERQWRLIFDYLGLTFDQQLLSKFNKTQLTGGLGDSNGFMRYDGISKEPLEKWKHTLANPIRKAWCKRYLRWIGKERMSVMGYDLNTLLEELTSVPTNNKTIGRDVLRLSKHMLKALPSWYHLSQPIKSQIIESDCSSCDGGLGENKGN